MTNINEINEKIQAEIKNVQKIEIEDAHKNSKLGNIFAVAILTAADKSQRDISKWAGKDGKLSVYEMAKAIEEINKKNIKLRGNHKDKSIKTRDKDRYTGRNERTKT